MSGSLPVLLSSPGKKEIVMKSSKNMVRFPSLLSLVFALGLTALPGFLANAQSDQTKPANPPQTEQTKPANPGPTDQAAPAVPSQPEQPKPVPVAQTDQTKPVYLRCQQGTGEGMVSPQETYWSPSKWCKIEYDDAGKFHAQTFFDGKCLFQYTLGDQGASKDCRKDTVAKSKPDKYFPFLLDPKELGADSGKAGRILGIDCEIYHLQSTPENVKDTCWSQLEGLVLQSMDFCSGKPCGMTLLNRVNNITPAVLQKKCWGTFADKKIMTK